MATATTTKDAAKAAREAADLLRNYQADDPSIVGIVTGLDALAAAPTNDATDTDTDDYGEAELAKSLEGIRETLTKSEGLPSMTRERLVKAERSLQRELLGKHNPAAAAEWDRTWGRVHGVA